ncbi:MAG: hypothetical protein PHY43_00260 [Verrucomicrobiales bacterium]|nr:hypothetical protein [Verrucomicrobiales bacterium]
MAARFIQAETGTHPQSIQARLPKADGIFEADPGCRLAKRDKKHHKLVR